MEELKNPLVNPPPQAMFIALPIVIVFYFIVNVAYTYLFLLVRKSSSDRKLSLRSIVGNDSTHFPPALSPIPSEGRETRGNPCHAKR